MGNYISKIFGASPVGPIQEHMDTCYRCAKELISFFEHALAGDWDKVSTSRDTIVALEHEADDLKRVIVEQRISDPWNEYRRLLSQEIANLRAHISEAQVSELQQKLETLEQGEAPHN